MNVQVKGRDNKNYTVGMDLASIIVDNFNVSIFGCPGLMRFKVMRDVISKGADGFIFVFDAAHPETDKDANIILDSIRDKDVSIVYLANKQDLKKEARTPDEIKKQNNLPKDCKIYPTSTKTGLNVKESIKYLVNEIYENHKETIKLLLNYEKDIRGLAIKLKMGRAAMRDFLYNLELKRFIQIDRINRTYKVKVGLKQ